MDIIVQRWNNDENRICGKGLSIEERKKCIENISEIFSKNNDLTESFLNLLELDIKKTKDVEYLIRIEFGKIFEIWAKKQRTAEQVISFLLSELNPEKIVGIVVYAISIYQDEIKK